MRLRHSSAPPELRAAQKDLERITKEKDAAINAQEYEQAATLREAEATSRESVDKLRADWQSTMSGETPKVDDEEIAQVVAMWTGIPVTRIAQEESERLLKMEEALHQRVIGQEEAIKTVSAPSAAPAPASRIPSGPSARSSSSAPPGVGKTELAKALAEFMFGSEDTLIKIDMSEFMERHNVSRLVGAPPGYVGFDEGGQLTEAVRRKSYSVDPARRDREGPPGGLQHPAPDPGGRAPHRRQGPPGRLPEHDHHHDLEPRGREDPDQLQPRLPPAGDTVETRAAASYELMKEKVQTELKTNFRPEFLNRIDATVVFRSLTVEEITPDRRPDAQAGPRPAARPRA